MRTSGARRLMECRSSAYGWRPTTLSDRGGSVQVCWNGGRPRTSALAVSGVAVTERSEGNLRSGLTDARVSRESVQEARPRL